MFLSVSALSVLLACYMFYYMVTGFRSEESERRRLASISTVVQMTPFGGGPPIKILDRTRLVTTVFIRALVNRSTDCFRLSSLYRISSQPLLSGLFFEV